jgi:hypothetical protein
MVENRTGLGQDDLPMVHRAASDNSLRGQRQFLWETAANLIALVVAAAAGALSWSEGGVDWLGVLAAAAFFIAVLTRLDLLRARPERLWYEGRAAAESAKTLAWRYAVGGQPFGITAPNTGSADRRFLQRLNDILTDLPGLHLVPSAEGGEQITTRMRELRSATLEARRAAYGAGRIGAQRDWYAKNARWNRDRARSWGVALLLIEILGGIAALLRIANVLHTDLLGVASAVAAAGTSWLLAKQHETLAKAYSVTAHELAAIAARIDAPQEEETWAHFVDEAEEAISREHTLWRASRVEALLRPATVMN